MKSKYNVKLTVLMKHFEHKYVYAPSNLDDIAISTANINRPALQLTGFYDYFDSSRLQVIGIVESTYLGTLSHESRLETFERFMQYDIPALVIAHGCDAYPECLEMAKKYNRALITVEDDTADFAARVLYELHDYLAPRVTIHGVLVEIYGEGVLLTGDSGIGKSETALELIKRGHRLIADDAVEIKLIDKTLKASAPEMIRYYMELRGIGVINVRQIYGVGAIKPEGFIDLVVHMEPWVEGKAYDRLGLSDEYDTILGKKLPMVTIPVRPGRNLAVIMELAAMNNRQKKMGFNAAQMLADAHDAAIDTGIMF